MQLSARTIHDRRFPTSLRGYDKAEVDDFLAATARYVSSIEEQLAITRRKADRTREELDSLHDVLDQRLTEAHQARDAIIEKAHREAAAIAQAAGGTDPATARTAAAIISEAEAQASLRLREVDDIVESARTEAERTIRRAESDAALRLAEADRVLDEARREAKTMRVEAERRRTELELELGELRRVGAAATTVGGRGPTVQVGDDGDLVVDLRDDAPDPARNT